MLLLVAFLLNPLAASANVITDWDENWLRAAYEMAQTQDPRTIYHPQANIYFGGDHQFLDISIWTTRILISSISLDLGYRETPWAL